MRSRSSVNVLTSTAPVAPLAPNLPVLIAENVWMATLINRRCSSVEDSCLWMLSIRSESAPSLASE